MTSEPIGRLVDILAAVVIILIVPLLWFEGKSTEVIGKYADNEVRALKDDICMQGELTGERFEAFTRKISAGCEACEISIEGRRKVWEPVYDGNVFTGEVCAYDCVISFDEILDGIENGGFSFERGDRVEISVVRKNSADSGSLIAGLTGRKMMRSISAAGEVDGKSDAPLQNGG